MKNPPLLLMIVMAGSAPAAEPLPLSTEYWKDPAFRKAFNGSYRIEARIEPTVSSEERGLLVTVQELMEDSKRDEALAKLKGSSLTKDSAALTFNLGNLHFEEGGNEEAIAAYRKAIDQYPSFRRAHRNLALALVREGNLQEALDPLLEAIRLGDSSGTAYGLLGYCRMEREEWASALQAYRLAQLSEPEVVDWKAGIAQCLEHLGGQEEAVAMLDEVIAQRPAVPSYALLQANLHLDLGEPEEAVKALELPRRLGTLSPGDHLLLADLHLRAGRPDEARTRTEEAFGSEEAPALDRILSLLELAVSLRDWDLSRFLLEKAQGDPPTPRPLRRARARFLIASGDDPAAGTEQLRTLLQEDPTDGPALLALATHLADEGQTGEARLLLERATAVEESAADAWVELARLHVAARRYEEALTAVDQALALRPGGQLEAYRASLQALVEAAR